MSIFKTKEWQLTWIERLSLSYLVSDQSHISKYWVMLHMAKCLLLSITPSHFLHKQILPCSLRAIYSYLVYVMHLEDIGRFWLRTRAFQSLLPALTTPLKEFLSFFIITHRMKIILVTALGPVSKLNEKVSHHANTLQRRI